MTKQATSEEDITGEVLRRFDATANPRLKQIMQSLVKHAHAFVREVGLTEDEWFAGIQFLTDTGHMCSGRRQEFILLSDTLGVSMLVDLISHRAPAGATESTVFGPFYREHSPEMPAGGNIAPRDLNGTPTIVSGRVLNLQGAPIANAVLDVWQSNSEGFYDAQLGDDQLHMRGIFRTGQDGGYLIRTTRPLHYPIPTDGPVGKMLAATNRHPWRPGHIHFKVSADGYRPVTTHLFDSTDEYLDSDTVFGVKDSLIVEFTLRTAQDETAKQLGVAAPYMTAEYDFVLEPAR
jgi:catechol 1,2-dioxygenase